MTNGNQLTREEQAWLAEYQACEHEAGTSGTSYWTLASIFIGISTALLGIIIYAILANQNLFSIFTKAISTISLPGWPPDEIWMLRGIITVLAIVVIIILWKLRRWLKRVRFIQQVDFERMREIELELRMWRGWRIHTLDRYIPKHYDALSDEQLWAELRQQLEENLSTKYSSLINDREWVLVHLFKRFHPQSRWHRFRNKAGYEQPTGTWVFNWMFWPLISLWLVLLIVIYLAPLIVLAIQ